MARSRARLRWLIDAYASPLIVGPPSCPWQSQLDRLAGPPIAVEAGSLNVARPSGAREHELVTVDANGYVHRLAALPSADRRKETV